MEHQKSGIDTKERAKMFVHSKRRGSSKRSGNQLTGWEKKSYEMKQKILKLKTGNIKLCEILNTKKEELKTFQQRIVKYNTESKFWQNKYAEEMLKREQRRNTIECQNGSNCRFWKSGRCRYYHSTTYHSSSEFHTRSRY